MSLIDTENALVCFFTMGAVVENQR